MLTSEFDTKLNFRKKYTCKLLESILLIIQKFNDQKLNEVEKLSYFSGIKAFLTLKKMIPPKSIYQIKYNFILKLLKENWCPGLSKKEKQIEEIL